MSHDTVRLEVRYINETHRGLFALEDIPRGVVVIQYKGAIVSGETLKERENRDDSRNLYYLFYLDENRCIDGLDNGCDAIYANHSCDPNCRIIQEGDDIFLKSRRKIKAGEEITYDYNFDDVEDPIECWCRSKKCRGYIMSKSTLKKYNALMQSLNEKNDS